MEKATTIITSLQLYTGSRTAHPIMHRHKPGYRSRTSMLRPIFSRVACRSPFAAFSKTRVLSDGVFVVVIKWWVRRSRSTRVNHSFFNGKLRSEHQGQALPIEEHSCEMGWPPTLVSIYSLGQYISSNYCTGSKGTIYAKGMCGCGLHWCTRNSIAPSFTSLSNFQLTR